MANSTIVGSGSGAAFGIGAVLSRTFEVFSRGFGQVFVLALVPLLPLLAITLLIVLGRPTAVFAVAAMSIGGGLVAGLLQIIAQATILYSSFELMQGRTFTIGKSFEVGLRRFLPILGVSVLAVLAIGLGFLLFIVPVIILGCMFYVAIPVCVIERLGVLASLSRSGELTKGYRWQVFGLLLIVLVGSSLGGWVVGRVIGIIGSSLLSSLVAFLWQVVATAFGAILAAVVYHDLRAVKEGVDVSKLVNVFD
jgi:hypothetical protein